jgi:hypothetical protein
VKIATVSLAKLQALTSFKIIKKYSRTKEIYTVTAENQASPHALLLNSEQDGWHHPLQVMVGPQLDILAGYVDSSSALTARRGRVGIVSGSHRNLFAPRKWVATQDKMLPLTGHPKKISSPRYLPPQSFFLDGPIAEYILPFNYDFNSGESHGFTISRSIGFRPRYTITVHDDAIDRRIILATVVLLDRHASKDLRQKLINLTVNPLGI